MHPPLMRRPLERHYASSDDCLPDRDELVHCGASPYLVDLIALGREHREGLTLDHDLAGG